MSDLRPKSIDDFAADKKVGGIHKYTLDNIRQHVQGTKDRLDNIGRTAGEELNQYEDLRGNVVPSERLVSDAQQGVETCDVVLGKLDEIEGKS